MKMCTFH